MNSSHKQKWWSTLKSPVFDAPLFLPPLTGSCDGLDFDSGGQADLLSDYFDSKQ